MKSVATSPKRLFWMITLALFMPWLSVALEFGWGEQFIKVFALSVVIPLVFLLSGIPLVMFAGQMVSLVAFCYAVYSLCMRRYEPLPQDIEVNASNTDVPPEYTPSTTPTTTSGKQ